MNYVQMLGACPEEMVSVMAIIRFVVNAICIAVPIILIVLIILDLAKIVTSGKLEDKEKKEVTSRIVTRIIFAVLIFLVPTIVRLIFGVLPLPKKGDNSDMSGENATWRDCWDAGASGIVM